MLDRGWRLVRGRLARSMASLFLIRAVDQFMPLLVIPFLARWLGPEGWGLVAMAQSLALYGIVIVQYGFEFSGTRAVAQHRDGAVPLAELVGGIFATQLLLGVVVALGAFVVGATVPQFAARTELVIATLAFALVQGLYPLWYFVGRERVGLIAAVGITGKVLATITIFVVVEGPGDEWLVLASYACGAALSTVAGYGLILREVPAQWPGIALVRRTLRFGLALFVMRLAALIHTAGNTFLLGLLVAPVQVAVFAAGERLCRPVAWLLQPINVALMPRLVHMLGDRPEQAARLAGLSILLLTGIGAVFGLIVAALAPWLIAIVFGSDPDFEGAVPVMRIMAAIIPLTIGNAALINQWLIPNGLDRALNIVIVSSTVLNLFLAILIAPRFGAEGMAWVTIAVAVYVLLGLLFALRLNRLSPRLPHLGRLFLRR
jgi:polysaccharide transporter, PST family